MTTYALPACAGGRACRGDNHGKFLHTITPGPSARVDGRLAWEWTCTHCGSTHHRRSDGVSNITHAHKEG